MHSPCTSSSGGRWVWLSHTRIRCRHHWVGSVGIEVLSGGLSLNSLLHLDLCSLDFLLSHNCYKKDEKTISFQSTPLTLTVMEN